MSDVWKAAVSIDTVSVTGPGPDPGPGTYAGRILIARDTVQDWYYGLWVDLTQVFNGTVFEYHTIYYALVGKPTFGTQDPFDTNFFTSGWQTIFDTTSFPGSGIPLRLEESVGANGASYFGGGMLSITKDFDAAHLLFTTPLGSMTAPFTWFAPGNGFNPVISFDAEPMLGRGMAHQFIRPDDTGTYSDTQKWYDFYSYKNGVQFFGFALSAADPGSWTPWIQQTQSGFLAMVTNDGQETSRYRTSFTHAPADDTPLYRDQDTREKRFTMAPAGIFGLDLTTMPEHLMAWGVWTPESCTCVNVRHSHDAGQSWSETAAVSGTDTVASPSIQTFGVVVYVVYYDTTAAAALLTHSEDAGLTWKTPVPVSITGTNPRLLVSPDGIFFFFSLSGGDIVLQRSMDFGSTLFDAAPITVATSVPTQDFGAAMGLDRTVLVAYADSMGNWVTRVSADVGLTWSTA
jgi:hypothetical protein